MIQQFFKTVPLVKEWPSYSIAVLVPADEPLATGAVDIQYVVVVNEGFPMQRYYLIRHSPLPTLQFKQCKREYTTTEEADAAKMWKSLLEYSENC